ncbi:HD domain-containing protein [Thermosyntropha lipolytica DSM 11003]|uniref:HD domain-containing protein n=1 Tax=Thermosyntropha lipolytica DSM 11003 TaxID=1123382 RepID=A0A1M5LA38_9FIRM|nr:HD domain-containing phosphohydrolase [Thermosyntropha lipolytica]SHG61283.1 HD domain-containing protein [Thermosyntropha lipolytica DSM 11003]
MTGFSLEEIRGKTSLELLGQELGKKSGLIIKNAWKLKPLSWMKKHSEIGWRIVQNTPELAGIAEYILYHHERWDGKGYPRGLKGEEIPLPCRILAVADAYDAMTSDRPYRKAMSQAKAIEEITKHAGTQFDPEVVRAFMKAFYQNKIKVS